MALGSWACGGPHPAVHRLPGWPFLAAQQARLMRPVAGKGEYPWGTGSWEVGGGLVSRAGRPGWLYPLTSWDPRRGP